MLRFRLFVLIALVVFTPRAGAELRPPEVAIIAARGNAESEQLADYYAKARGIPAAQICRIDVPAGDECPREIWTREVRPAVTAWLAEHDPERKLRCLTTVWGVPLSIAAEESTPATRAYQAYLAGERDVRLASVRESILQLDALAPAGEISTDSVGAENADATSGDGATLAPAAPAEGSTEEVKWVQTQIEKRVQATQNRINELPKGPDRQTAQARLQQLVTNAGGAAVLMQNLQQQMGARLNSSDAMAIEYHRLSGAVQAWNEVRQSLERRPPGIERDAEILEVVQRVGGTFAAIKWLDDQTAAAAQNASAASFDSELALVLWPDYQLLGRQANYLAGNYDHSHLRTAFPTLMVARIDGPTPPLARGLVDAALEAERAGLMGKAYFDSRGIAGRADANAANQAAADFDRAILAAARGMQLETKMAVVVNEEPALFAAGTCPDAALYCGWFSLGRYVDAFTFNRGAVAYHAGGDEANGLHDAASQRWCKRLIEQGAAATIGAVFDERGVAFPRPNEFFRLLTAGDRTLAECFWQTQPSTSWSLVLIGDPLYRPFKNQSIAREPAAIRDAGR